MLHVLFTDATSKASGICRNAGKGRYRTVGPLIFALRPVRKDVAELIDWLGRRAGALPPRSGRGQGGRRTIEGDPDHGAEGVRPLEHGARDGDLASDMIGCGRRYIADLDAARGIDADGARTTHLVSFAAQLKNFARPALLNFR